MPSGRFCTLPNFEIVELYEQGNTATAIANKYSVQKSTICRLLQRNNVIAKTGVPLQFNHALACKMYKNGKEQLEIAKFLGVTQSAISKVIVANNLVKHKTDIRKIYFPNVERFKVIETEEDAYWLGFMFTDGNVYKNQITLKLQPCDKHILESFCIYLNVNTQIIKTKKNGLLSIQLMSKHIANNLKMQGCTERKTFTLQPPNIAEHLLPAFLKGAIDGDGGVYFNRNRFILYFCSASLPFITWVNEQWYNLCGISNIINKQGNVYQTQISGARAYALAQTLYSTNCPHLQRKYEKFQQAQLHYA